MAMQICAQLPQEIAEMIWRKVFDGVVATIANKKPGVSWKKNKSVKLKELLKEEVGAYQPGYADFDSMRMYLPHCIGCAYHNFPCFNCANYLYNEKLECSIFHYDFRSEDNEDADLIDDDNWEDPFNNEYIWD